MRPNVRPLTRLHRAIERGDLDLVRRTARECGALDLEDALRILILIRDKEPATYERAGVRWAGQLLAACPDLGFGGAEKAVRQVKALSGPLEWLRVADVAIEALEVGLHRPGLSTYAAERWAIEFGQEVSS